MASRRGSQMGLGLFLVALFALLFSPAFVQEVRADDVEDYGTVIGIVRSICRSWGKGFKKRRVGLTAFFTGSWNRRFLPRRAKSSVAMSREILCRLTCKQTYSCVGVMEKGKVEMWGHMPAQSKTGPQQVANSSMQISKRPGQPHHTIIRGIYRWRASNRRR